MKNALFSGITADVVVEPTEKEKVIEAPTAELDLLSMDTQQKIETA